MCAGRYGSERLRAVGSTRPQKKDVAAIMTAHGLDYVATASAAYPLDLCDKIKKAISLQGVKYIHIPCRST